MHQAGQRKRRVALVDLNDNESGLILQYHHHPEWEVVALVSAENSVWPARLARSCGVPVIGAIGEVLPLGCDRIVIGAKSTAMQQQLTSLLNSAGTEICGPIRPDVGVEPPAETDTMERAPIMTVVPDEAPDPDAIVAESVLAEPPAETNDTPAAEFESPPSPQVTAEEPVAPFGSVDLEAGSVEVTVETAADAPADEAPEPAPMSAPALPGAPPPLRLAPTPENMVGTGRRDVDEPGEYQFTADVTPEFEAGVRSALAFVNPAAMDAPTDEASRADVCDDIWSSLGEIRINPSRGDLFNFLRSACQRMKATSASLALPEPDGLAVRLVAWYGLPAELVANPRKSLDCAAGRALTERRAQVNHATPLSLAEDDAPPMEQTLVSLPVLGRSRTLAALSFALPRHVEIDPAELPRSFRDIVNEAEFQLLKSVDTDLYNWAQRREVLLHGADRAMSLDESLPERLRAIGDMITLFLGGSVCHLYLTDLLGEKLQLISRPTGPGNLGARFQDARSGLMGWVLRMRAPSLFLPAAEPADGSMDRQGLLMFPLFTEHRVIGLLAVEGIHIAAGDESEARRALDDLSRLMEEMLDVEQGIGDQDLYQQLRLRFREVVPMLEGRAPLERAQMALDAAVETLAAEVAIWMSPRFTAPVLPARLNQAAFPALGRVWPSLDELAAFVRENGRAWSLPSDPTVGPDLSHPYAAVAEPERDGVLIVLFEQTQVAQMGTQLNASTIMEMLHNIGEQVEDQPIRSTDGPGGQPVLSGPGIVLSVTDLTGRVMEEWIRSVRFGHGFSVSRISLGDAPGAEALREPLREFLGKVQRNVDFLAEIRPGTFGLLSPETERFPEGLQFRLQAMWRAEHGDTPLVIEQKIYPRDGQGRRPYLDFISGVA